MAQIVTSVILLAERSTSIGLAQGTLDRFPLLLVSDTVTRKDSSWVDHQRLDQTAVTSPLTKWSGTLGNSDSLEVVTASVHLAESAPKGAVHLNFDPSIDGDPPPILEIQNVRPNRLVDRAKQLLAGSKRPVIVVGLGALDHVDEVRLLLKDLQCPILVTYEAKGVVPESWTSFAGFFTGSTLEKPILEGADLIFGIGLGSVEPMPNRWSYQAPVVLFSSYPIEGSYFGGKAATIIGSYSEHLPELLQRSHTTWDHGIGQKIHRQNLGRMLSDTTGFSQADVVRSTQEMVGEAIVTVDAGAHMLVAMSLWKTDRPASVLISNGLATMGFALPAGIGAALAEPNRDVVCFVGDGGLGMTMAELETIQRLGLWITIIVFNDSSLSLIKLKQAKLPRESSAVSYAPIDFSGVAQAMGVTDVAALDTEDLRQGLKSRPNGPMLIDAHRPIVIPTRAKCRTWITRIFPWD